MKTPTKKFSPTALIAWGAMSQYLRPRLAQDSKVDLIPAFAGVTAKNLAEKKPLITSAIIAAVKGKLAQDADVSDLPQMLDQIETLATAASAVAGGGAEGGADPAAAGGDPAMGGGEDDGLSDIVGMIMALSPEDRARLEEMLQTDPGSAAAGGATGAPPKDAAGGSLGRAEGAEDVGRAGPLIVRCRSCDHPQLSFRPRIARPPSNEGSPKLRHSACLISAAENERFPRYERVWSSIRA